MATDMPATTMVTFVGTKKPYDQKRARADFGDCSVPPDMAPGSVRSVGSNQRSTAVPTPGSQQKETDKSFCQCHGNMCKQGLILHMERKVLRSGRTAEDKGIDPSRSEDISQSPINRTKRSVRAARIMCFFFLPCKI